MTFFLVLRSRLKLGLLWMRHSIKELVTSLGAVRVGSRHRHVGVRMRRIMSADLAQGGIIRLSEL